MSVPLLTVTANLQKITGSIDAASILYTLTNFSGIPRISGTAIIAQPSFKATADGSGNTSTTLWARDQITPTNTLYKVTVFDDGNNQIGNPVYYILNAGGSPGTVDLSTVDPVDPSGLPIISPPVTTFPGNEVLASPADGSTGVLAVRALVPADVPVPALVTKTANYTSLTSDDTIQMNSASATALTLTTSGLPTGKRLLIKNINSGVVTVTGATGTIQGQANAQLFNGDALSLYFDGTNFSAF